MIYSLHSQKSIAGEIMIIGLQFGHVKATNGRFCPVHHGLVAVIVVRY